MFESAPPDWLRTVYEVINLLPQPWRFVVLALIAYSLLRGGIHFLRAAVPFGIRMLVRLWVRVLGTLDLQLSDLTVRLTGRQWPGAELLNRHLESTDTWVHGRRGDARSDRKTKQRWLYKRELLLVAMAAAALWYVPSWAPGLSVSEAIVSAQRQLARFESWALAGSPVVAQTAVPSTSLPDPTGVPVIEEVAGAPNHSLTAPPPTPVATTPAATQDPSGTPTDVGSPESGWACPRTEACLLSPRHGADLRGVVDIVGTADRPAFAYYKLEVRLTDGVWAFLAQGDQPIANGLLATWDTTLFPNGRYRLRLTIVDQTGNYWPETPEIAVVIAN